MADAGKSKQTPCGYLPLKVRIAALLAAVVLGPAVTALVGGGRAETLWSIPVCVVTVVLMDQLYAWIDRRDRRG